MKRVDRGMFPLVVAGAALVLATQACTTERDPVFRAPYEALDKKMFEGEFFYKMTTTDLPYSVDYSFIGEASTVRTIRWEITKNWLIAYDIHDDVNAFDSEGNRFNNHTPVVAFPIAQHFDLRNAENPITGEDLPMTVPNTDMDWHEAPYFVIDPTSSGISVYPDKFQNLIYEIENPFHTEMVGGYWEMEFYDKNHNYLQPVGFKQARTADPNLAVDEISFYTQSFNSPNHDFYAWWTWTRDEWFFKMNYDSARIQHRHEFKRVDRAALDANRFVKIDMDDYLFRRFGYFVSDFLVYDKDVGMATDATWYKWANYFNTEIDPATNRPRQIVYYTNGLEYPKRMVTSGCAVAVDFNQAFREAVFVREHPGALNSELPTLPLDEQYVLENWNTDDIEEQTKIAEMCLGIDPAKAIFDDADDVFVMKAVDWEPYVPARDGVDPDGRRNSVVIDPFEHYPYIALPQGWKLTDRGKTYEAACEKTLEQRCKLDAAGHIVPRVRQRLGDLDSSFMYWVAKPTDYGILGVAQWSANPETGQIFGGVGHIAGAVLTWPMQRAMDQFDILAGFGTIEDVIDPRGRGQPQNYVVVKRNAPYQTEDGANTLARSSLEQIQEMDAAPRSQGDLMRVMQQQQAHYPPLSGRLPLDAVKGTKWERLMASDSVSDWMFQDPGVSSAGALKHTGPSSMFSMEGMKREIKRITGLTTGCYFQADWTDGVVLDYARAKVAERDKLVSEGGMTVEAATAKVRAAMYTEFERLMYRGVLEHEIGHSVGLRHNFIGSTDELNFIGEHPWEDPAGEGTGYWPAMKRWKQEYANIKAANPSASGRELYELGEAIAGQRNLYRYASVMDYQSESYIHSAGLGRYDIAALKFVYGRSIEKWRPYQAPLKTQAEIGAMSADEKAAYEADQAKTETYLQVSYQPWYDTHTGGIPLEPMATVKKTGAQNFKLSIDSTKMVPILDNADVKPYKYCNDQLRYEDAFCNTFDAGVSGREIVRNMIRDYNKFYYYRFFRRGNPRFTELRWSNYLWSVHFPIAHFALDFNFNLARKDDWLNALFITSGGANAQRDSYRYAMVQPESAPDFDDKVPAGSIGDYAIAAMEGFNFFLYDVIYRPEVGAYVSTSPEDIPADEQENFPKYWAKNPYIIPDDRIDEFGSQFESLSIGVDIGRFHRNRWDIQDDDRIFEEKFLRRGFTTEKTAASFMLTNTGWPPEKYARENMANGYTYITDGFQNAVFQMMTDMNTEDSMLSFSNWCIQRNTGGAEKPFTLVQVQPPLQATWMWGAFDRLDFRREYSNPYKPGHSFCETLNKKLEPMHAGWVYFDKMWPTLWGSYGLANSSADLTVLQFFTAERIPADRHDDWAPLNPATQVEFLNTSNRYWYRATKAVDGRPTPAYEAIARAARIRKICEERRWENVEPYDQIADCRGWRTLEVTEATLINNADFSAFWSSLTGLIFGK